MRPRQSAIPLLIALVFVIAAMIYLSRMSYSPQPAKISVAPSERAGPADIYPIAALTPGATNPAITQANIDETICNPHWSTKSIRPPEEYTYRLKREQIGEYHDSDTRAADYEEDHLIPLELGGNPRIPKIFGPSPILSRLRMVARNIRTKWRITCTAKSVQVQCRSPKRSNVSRRTGIACT